MDTLKKDHGGSSISKRGSLLLHKANLLVRRKEDLKTKPKSGSQLASKLASKSETPEPTNGRRKLRKAKDSDGKYSRNIKKATATTVFSDVPENKAEESVIPKPIPNPIPPNPIPSNSNNNGNTNGNNDTNSNTNSNTISNNISNTNTNSNGVGKHSSLRSIKTEDPDTRHDLTAFSSRVSVSSLPYNGKIRNPLVDENAGNGSGDAHSQMSKDSSGRNRELSKILGDSSSSGNSEEHVKGGNSDTVHLTENVNNEINVDEIEANKDVDNEMVSISEGDEVNGDPDVSTNSDVEPAEKVSLFEYTGLKVHVFHDQLTDEVPEIGTSGRMLGHGTLLIFQINNGMMVYLLCGPLFVYPLLPKLKVLRIGFNTFMLPLVNPERYWRITLETDQEDVIRKFERVLKAHISYRKLYKPDSDRDGFETRKETRKENKETKESIEKSKESVEKSKEKTKEKSKEKSKEKPHEYAKQDQVVLKHDKNDKNDILINGKSTNGPHNGHTIENKTKGNINSHHDIRYQESYETYIPFDLPDIRTPEPTLNDISIAKSRSIDRHHTPTRRLALPPSNQPRTPVAGTSFLSLAIPESPPSTSFSPSSAAHRDASTPLVERNTHSISSLGSPPFDGLSNPNHNNHNHILNLNLKLNHNLNLKVNPNLNLNHNNTYQKQSLSILQPKPQVPGNSAWANPFRINAQDELLNQQPHQAEQGSDKLDSLMDSLIDEYEENMTATIQNVSRPLSRPASRLSHASKVSGTHSVNYRRNLGLNRHDEGFPTTSLSQYNRTHRERRNSVLSELSNHTNHMATNNVQAPHYNPSRHAESTHGLVRSRSSYSVASSVASGATLSSIYRLVTNRQIFLHLDKDDTKLVKLNRLHYQPRPKHPPVLKSGYSRGESSRNGQRYANSVGGEKHGGLSGEQVYRIVKEVENNDKGKKEVKFLLFLGW